MKKEVGRFNIPDGEHTTKYASGNLKAVGNYLNGKLHGQLKLFDDYVGNEPHSIYTYVNGVSDEVNLLKTVGNEYRSYLKVYSPKDRLFSFKSVLNANGSVGKTTIGTLFDKPGKYLGTYKDNDVAPDDIDNTIIATSSLLSVLKKTCEYKTNTDGTYNYETNSDRYTFIESSIGADGNSDITVKFMNNTIYSNIRDRSDNTLNNIQYKFNNDLLSLKQNKSLNTIDLVLFSRTGEI